MKGYSLPEKLEQEINDLEKLISEYKNGNISFAELKAHRVPFGVYEQREKNTYMVRIRCAAGYITPRQLEEIAKLSLKYGIDKVHITTRQELQVHQVKLDNIILIIRALKKIGLASRGGGGNTVRNVIAHEDAGINNDEAFDITPYAIAITTRLIQEDDSWTLPRKFKVAFSGSGQDKGNATVTDVGFIAVKKDGKKGFKVYTAGGLGAKPKVGHLILDFIADSEVYNVTKALKNLFWKYGNRKNKHAARLRFVWETLGKSEFRKRFNEELVLVKEKGYKTLDIVEIDNIAQNKTITKEPVDNLADFDLWKKRFVNKQKQDSLMSVSVPIEFGFIDNIELKNLGKFLQQFGDNIIRLTKDQNILLRNIEEQYLGNVYNFIKSCFKGFNRSAIYGKMISCAGASTCQLGICLSRGLARAIMEMLDTSNLDIDSLSDVKINISGCSNACGQHPLADIGFYGRALRKDGSLYPAYTVLGGAVIEEGKSKLATDIAQINVKDIPQMLRDFFALFLSKKKEFSDFKEYIRGQGFEDLKKLCEKYQNIPSFLQDKNYYFDWGDSEVFSLANRRSGECSAGIFDLIDIDVQNIKNIEKDLEGIDNDDANRLSEKLGRLVFYASRMLLITRGTEPKTTEAVYENFNQHFILTGLVDSKFTSVIELAKSKNYLKLLENKNIIYELVARVNFLYGVMDNVFQFKETNKKIESEAESGLKQAPQVFKVTAKLIKDFRGVSCPMNFVKTKIELAKIANDEILQIFLDDGEPIDNVPGSVKAEGHQILGQEKIDDYWVLTIKKK